MALTWWVSCHYRVNNCRANYTYLLLMETCIWPRDAKDQSSHTFCQRVLQHVRGNRDWAHCDGKAIKIIDFPSDNWAAGEASWRCSLMRGWVIITATWRGPIGALLTHSLCMKLIHGTHLPTADHVVPPHPLIRDIKNVAMPKRIWILFE